MSETEQEVANEKKEGKGKAKAGGQLAVESGSGKGKTVKVIGSDGIWDVKDKLMSAYRQVSEMLENKGFRCKKCGETFETQIECVHCGNVFTPFNAYHQINAARAMAPLAKNMRDLLNDEAKISQILSNAEVCREFMRVVVEAIKENVRNEGEVKAVLDRIGSYVDEG